MSGSALGWTKWDPLSRVESSAVCILNPSKADYDRIHQRRVSPAAKYPVYKKMFKIAVLSAEFSTLIPSFLKQHWTHELLASSFLTMAATSIAHSSSLVLSADLWTSTKTHFEIIGSVFNSPSTFFRISQCLFSTLSGALRFYFHSSNYPMSSSFSDCYLPALTFNLMEDFHNLRHNAIEIKINVRSAGHTTFFSSRYTKLRCHRSNCIFSRISVYFCFSFKK